MRSGTPSLSTLLGAFPLVCLIAGSEAFIVPALPSFSVSSWQTTCESHLGRTMQQQTCTSALNFQAAPLRSGGELHYCASPSYSLLAPSAVSASLSTRGRRRSSALGANTGSGGGGGGGTQQLSREAKLAISVLIDLVGMSSYALPGLGEVSDIGWAPISSALILYLYGNNIFAGLAFVEEIMPGFDIIPTATISWFLTNSEVGQNVTNAASGKAGGSTKTRSSAAPPDPPSSASSPPPPYKNADARGAARDGETRTVDDNLVQSGVIDVNVE